MIINKHRPNGVEARTSDDRTLFQISDYGLGYQVGTTGSIPCSVSIDKLEEFAVELLAAVKAARVMIENEQVEVNP